MRETSLLFPVFDFLNQLKRALHLTHFNFFLRSLLFAHDSHFSLRRFQTRICSYFVEKRAATRRGMSKKCDNLFSVCGTSFVDGNEDGNINNGRLPSSRKLVEMPLSRFSFRQSNLSNEEIQLKLKALKKLERKKLNDRKLSLQKSTLDLAPQHGTSGKWNRKAIRTLN